jgi:hypothetical protein
MIEVPNHWRCLELFLHHDRSHSVDSKVAEDVTVFTRVAEKGRVECVGSGEFSIKEFSDSETDTL